MVNSPENNPERRISILGKEIGPGEIGLGGYGLVALSVLSVNSPCLAVPLLLAGGGVILYSIRKMERE